ncbi:hypothetical protein GBAR_LOCUS21630 [Geodia barretti]|nr:hypothetical protein GBAR_LOCUS21630 [Geodia barretti]
MKRFSDSSRDYYNRQGPDRASAREELQITASADYRGASTKDTREERSKTSLHRPRQVTRTWNSTEMDRATPLTDMVDCWCSIFRGSL